MNLFEYYSNYVSGITKQYVSILKTMDEQRHRDFLNKVNSRPRRKRK